MTAELMVSDTFTDEYARRFAIVQAGVSRFDQELQELASGQEGLPRAATEAYRSVLSRGGGRARGVLTVTGIMIHGGVDVELMEDAAGLVEGVQADLLVCDDVYDNSDSRRGGPTAQRMLEAELRASGQFEGNKDLGNFLALNAARVMQHAIQERMSYLNVSAERYRLASRLMNRYLKLTGVGQADDMTGHLKENYGPEDALKTAIWKAAIYTYLKPLVIGTTLEGAEKDDAELFTDYATHAGLGFQLTDDDLMFSSKDKSGKSPMDDLKEGKRPFVVLRALELITDKDGKEVLRTALGNKALTPEHFEAVKSAIITSGAREEALDLAERHVALAVEALDRGPELWTPHKQFLADLAIRNGTRRAA